MLNIICGYFYINELIYVCDNYFLCLLLIAFVNGYMIVLVDYKCEFNVFIYYYCDMFFFFGYKMIYMQWGNYVVVINFFFWSEVMFDDLIL